MKAWNQACKSMSVSGKYHPIPQISLASFRTISRDLDGAQNRAIYRHCRKVSGVLIDIHIKRISELGEGLLAAELRDACLCMFDLGQKSHAILSSGPIRYINAFTIDGTSAETIKASMRNLSGRLTQSINKHRHAAYQDLREQGLRGQALDQAFLSAYLEAIRRHRSSVWRILLASWQAGQMMRNLEVNKRLPPA
ncbi:hypothetical protein KUV57_11370 [Epibacterium sp. DP7N7-1]|nr:hypothetical protein [Epibacterium sp. DP7N7-1]